MNKYPVPFWLTVVLCLTPPILTALFFRVWRDEKWQVGACPQCGLALDGVAIQGRRLLCSHGTTTCSIWCVFVRARMAQLLGSERG